ncbi:MAG: 2,3-bisphosphoglycerate-independent phosphoglycerate mutase [Candidatus Hodarchaeota archaeon]
MLSPKAILVVLDGIGDRPIPQFNNRTPLQAAETPILDKLARDGCCGIMDVISPGYPVGSDVAHLTMLGYDFENDYPGRGPLEALGVGMDIGENDIALRGNLAHVDHSLVIVDRRAGRQIPEAEEFVGAVDGLVLENKPGIVFHAKHSTEQRVACVIRGKGLSMAFSSTNPNRNYTPIEKSVPLDDSVEAKNTASIINDITFQIYVKLKESPLNEKRKEKGLPLVNTILFHGAGKLKKVKGFQEKYNLKAGCVTGNGLIRGVCKYVGIDILPCKGATGTLETDLDEKINVLLSNMDNHDFLLLHIKATDSTGHDKKPEKKKQFIEKVDKALARLISNMDYDSTYIFITGDHTTPCEVGDHSGDPVPVLIAGPTVIKDDVEKFDETSCAAGYLSRIRGKDFFNLVLNKLGKLEKFGA